MVQRVAPVCVFGGLVVVLSMLLVFALDPRVLMRRDTEILLAMDEQHHVSGVVMHGGEAIKVGQVRVSFDQKDEDEAIGATHVGTELITLNGKTEHFEAGGATLKFQGTRPSILVRADYRGPDPVRKGATLEASAILYSNCPAPFSTEELLRGLSLLVGAALVLVYLFTGHLSDWKAQALFAATYCFIFLAVSLPIGGLVVISQKPYLIAMMQKSPLGLVKARTKALEHAQWLVNVGGVPVHDVDAEHKLKEEEAKQLPAPLEVADTSDPELTSMAPSRLSADNDTPRQPTAEAKAKLESEDNRASNQLKIEGGLAIPFYVLLFAVFGGGINMMRTVPRIQSNHVLGMRDNQESLRGQWEIGCDVRKDVIAQYMYLLSAPFLAIAVFYLLQIIATSISEPVLVLMAFSAGLTSELIISAIIAFAENTLNKMRGPSDKPAEQGAATPSDS